MTTGCGHAGTVRLPDRILKAGLDQGVADR
jgi:hypothetical protein